MWGFDSLEAMKTTLDVEKRAEKSKKQVRRNPRSALFNLPSEIDPKTEKKVKQVSDKVSECLHIVANEPSLGLYRLQEHVRRSVPALVSVKKEVNGAKEKVQGLVYDAEYGIKTLETMSGIESFSAVQEHLKAAIDYKRRLNAKRIEKERQAYVGYYEEFPVPSQFSPVVHPSKTLSDSGSDSEVTATAMSSSPSMRPGWKQQHQQEEEQLQASPKVQPSVSPFTGRKEESKNLD
ncbi:uncharacterized protein [Oscarella lobularis]|uniref:uncharacterized protein n=1 Tax=Oscarella lobularis TaxID=121494 RepID=UPI00331337F6